MDTYRHQFFDVGTFGTRKSSNIRSISNFANLSEIQSKITAAMVRDGAKQNRDFLFTPRAMSNSKRIGVTLSYTPDFEATVVLLLLTWDSIKLRSTL